jgi:hypothetical protein
MEKPFKSEWVILDSDGQGRIGRCTRCGDVLRLKLPMSLKAFAMYLTAFAEEHCHCEEPSPNEATR